jgi:hypothetical protein
VALARHCVERWKQWASGDHVVRLFEGSGASWTATRVIAGGFGAPGGAAGQLGSPYGLRLTAGGTELVVAESCTNGRLRVSMFHVEDGSFVRHVATGLNSPMDVEQCKGGWLVACSCSHTIEFVSGAAVEGGAPSRSALGGMGLGSGEFFCPTTLTIVPGVGLGVLDEFDSRGRLQLFAAPASIALASMSASRVGWMVAVARGVLHRMKGSAPLTQAPTGLQEKRVRVQPH